MGRAIDALDFRLLATMRVEPLGTHESWGRAVERGASTVRRRIADLAARGILQGFQGRPAAGALGLHALGAVWDTAVDLDALLELDGTVEAGTSIDGRTHVGAYTPDPDAWLDAARVIARRAPAKVIPGPPYNGPVLGPLDLRVMLALVRDPRGTAEALAASSGLASKTVRRRRDALLATGALRVQPVVRFGHSGAIVYHVHVECGPQDARAVHAALQETFGGYDDCPFLCTYARAATLDDQARRLQAVRALGHDVEVVHEDEMRTSDDAVVVIIERALAPWQRAGAPGPPTRQGPG